MKRLLSRVSTSIKNKREENKTRAQDKRTRQENKTREQFPCNVTESEDNETEQLRRDWTRLSKKIVSILVEKQDNERKHPRERSLRSFISGSFISGNHLKRFSHL